MRRGDIVVVAAAGDYGKPRPAVVVQTNALVVPDGSVILCPMTSELVEAPAFRVTVDASPDTGLRVTSQIMADKPLTVRRARVGQTIGSLRAEELAQLNSALAFVMGLAD